jgi:hypothetical protein
MWHQVEHRSSTWSNTNEKQCNHPLLSLFENWSAFLDRQSNWGLEPLFCRFFPYFHHGDCQVNRYELERKKYTSFLIAFHTFAVEKEPLYNFADKKNQFSHFFSSRIRKAFYLPYSKLNLNIVLWPRWVKEAKKYAGNFCQSFALGTYYYYIPWNMISLHVV